MYAYINPSLPVYPSPQQPVYIPLAYTVHWFVVNAQGYYNNCFFKKNFLFCIGVQPVNNIMIVSGGQQRDSAIHTHVSVLPQNPLPSRLPQLFLNRLWSHLLWRQVTKNYLCKPLFSSETHLCRHTVIRLQACNILSPSPLPEVQSPGTKHLLSHLF